MRRIMRLQVRVTPRTRKPGIETAGDGTLVVKVREPAEDGRANAAVIEALEAMYRTYETFREHLDHDTYQALAAASDEWMRVAARYCESRDPLLDLSDSVPHGDKRVASPPVTNEPARAIPIGEEFVRRFPKSDKLPAVREQLERAKKTNH